MDLPVIDSPKTPGTPVSPTDITIQKSESQISEPITYSDCLGLAKAVSFCSKSLIEGTWQEVSDVRGRKPWFIPDNFESAKAFLRASVEVLPPRIQSSNFGTPVTSRPRAQSAMVVCHGCHGPMGGGQHQGSAPGKNVCSHKHSHFCKGGIPEDQSWAPCPPDYVYNPDLDLAAGPGFESTLHTINFIPSTQYLGPPSSTPNVSPNFSPPGDQHIQQQQQGTLQLPGHGSQHVMVDQHVGDAASLRTTGDRFSGVQTGRGYPLTDPDNRLPGMVSMGTATTPAPGNVPQPPFQPVSENIQSNIDSLRAANQNERLMTDRPTGASNITVLRADPNLRVDVENVMEGFIRPRIPSVSAAMSAPASAPHSHPSTDSQHGYVSGDGHGAYRYNTPQLHQVRGDGIRVTADTAGQPALGAIPKVRGPPAGPVLQEETSQQGNQQPSRPFPPHGHHHNQHLQGASGQHLPEHNYLAGNPPQQSNVSAGHSAGHHHNQHLQGASRQQQVPDHNQTVGNPSQHSNMFAGQQQQHISVYAPTAGQQHQQSTIPTGQYSQHQTGLSSAQQPAPRTSAPTHHNSGQQYQTGQQQLMNQGNGSQHHLAPGQYQHQSGGMYQTQGMQGPGYNQHQPLPSIPTQGTAQCTRQHQHHHPGNPGIPSSPVYQYEWRINPHTGQSYQVQVPAYNQPCPSYHNQQAGLPPQQHQQFCTPPPQNRSEVVTYRTEFRISPTSGRQWQVQVPIINPPAPTTQPSFEWRIHPHTGSRYQVQVSSPHQYVRPAYQNQQLEAPHAVLGPGQGQSVFQGYQYPGPSPNSNQPNHDRSQHLQQSAILPHEQPGNNTMSKQERVAGIVSLLEGGGGVKKQPKVLELAKKCPTKWSKQATMANINLPLYAWGVVEELEAAMSGRAPALQEGVTLGKLRHLKNTLEVCCLNSTSTDFTGFGWTLAKDYAIKVNDEIEMGRATWQDMPLEVKTSTLMSANMENPRPPPKFDPRGPTKVGDKKDLCTTYNKCITEGKCDYEVANPDRTCLRKHECSWCRAHKKQGWKHQALRCKAKEASGGT